jgi:hypothetical protein
MAWNDDACVYDDPLPAGPHHRGSIRRRRNGQTLHSQRLAMEEILRRARFLPKAHAALLHAFLELKMPIGQLALLHGISRSALQRRLQRWRNLLSDPDFLLAARFGPELSPELASLARRYWIDGRSLRQIASEDQVTLHRIRSRLAEARLLLVRASAAAALRL